MALFTFLKVAWYAAPIVGVTGLLYAPLAIVFTVAAFVCLVVPHSVATKPIDWLAFWVESWPLSVTGEP